MKPKDLKKIIEEYQLAPNKKLGQNFLINENLITSKIIPILKLKKNDSILEIGPGLGALTEYLAGQTTSLALVELDKGFVRYLKKKFSDLTIIQDNFLKINLPDKFNKIVSNLPYYCASEIIFLIATKYLKAQEVYLTIQKEMAERILAISGTKSYGALTINLNFYFKPKILFKIKANSFFPVPEVDSSFIKLERRKNKLLPLPETPLFHKIVKSAFWGRRKMLKKALLEAPHLNLELAKIDSVWKDLKITPKIRAEDLSLDDFVKITKRISQL